MSRLMNTRPTADGGYPLDRDLHQMSDDGGPVGSDPAQWDDPEWRDNLGERDTFADDVPQVPQPVRITAADWTPIAVAMPPEGMIVDTLTP